MTKTYGREKYIRREYPATTIAYLAGIIDGEGSITAGSYAKTKSGNPAYTTYMSVSNTEGALIDWLKDTFGGFTGCYTKNQTPTNSRKPVFLWQTSGDRLLHLCELILPYSTIKKRQIEIMIELRKTFTNRMYVRGHSGPHIVEEVTTKRMALCKELRSCHNRLSAVRD